MSINPKKMVGQAESFLRFVRSGTSRNITQLFSKRGYRTFRSEIQETALKTDEQRGKINSTFLDNLPPPKNDYFLQDSLPIDRRIQAEKKLLEEIYNAESIDSQCERHRNCYLNSQTNDQEIANKVMGKIFGSASKQVNAGNVSPDHPKLLSFIKSNGEDRDFDGMAQKNRKYVNNKLQFQNTLQNIIGKKNEQTRKHGLEDLIFSHKGGIDRFTNEQLTQLFHTAWDIDAKKIMVEMMETSKNASFTGSPTNLQFYVQAQLKSRYENIHNAVAVANLLLDINPHEPEAHTILGIIERIKASTAHNFLEMKKNERYDDKVDKAYHQCFPDYIENLDAVKTNYQESLKQSIKHYTKSFELKNDPRIGRLITLRYLEQEAHDPAAHEKALEMAKLTQMSALKEGGIEHSNFAVVRALLESSYVLKESDDVLSTIEASFVALVETSSQIENAIGQMSYLVDHLEPSYRERGNKLLSALERADGVNDLKEIAKGFIKGRSEEGTEATQFVDNNGYTLRGSFSNWVHGNFKFGGQLPDKNINRTDWKIFREILDIPLEKLKIYDPVFFENSSYSNLTEVPTIGEFSKYCDHLIRGALNVEHWDLENLYSEGHKKYDNLVHKITQLSGIQSKDLRKAVSHSKTNISLVLTTGLGDCRHVTQIKQMLFQAWQNERLEGVINEYMRLENSPEDHKKKHALEAQFNQWNSEQIMTFDFEVHMPIRLDSDKRPELGVNGQVIANKSGKEEFIEEHTMNCIVKKNDLGIVESFRLADGFYQKEYDFGDTEVNVEKFAYGETIPVTKKEGIKVSLKPTVYAGPRNQYDKGSEDLLYCGMPVTNMLTADKIVGMKESKDTFFEELNKWEYD